MGLTPDEIAERAFTPSVDGYHKGEVRDFLARIAAQLRGLQSVLPDGRIELAEVATVLQDHTPQLVQHEQHLARLIAELAATALEIRATQAELAPLVTGARGNVHDEAAITAVIDAHRDLVSGLAAHQQAMLADLVAQQRASDERLRFARELVADQQTVADQLAAANVVTTSHLEAAKAISAQAGTAAARIDSALAHAAAPPVPVAQPAPALVVQPAPAPPRPPASLYTDPIDGAVFESPRRVATGTASAPLGNPEQPLIADSANQLLDGVLNDVMGQVAEDGHPTR